MATVMRGHHSSKQVGLHACTKIRVQVHVVHSWVCGPMGAPSCEGGLHECMRKFLASAPGHLSLDRA